MASQSQSQPQSTTSASAVQSPSVSLTSVPPASAAPPTTSAANSQSPSTLSTSQQTRASSQQSASISTSALASASLSSASQVTSVPNSTSQSLPSQPTLVGNGVSNTPDPGAGQPISPMKIIIPVISAVAGLLLVSYLYRRYRRRRKLREVPLPAKRTPVILERRPAQSMYRFETPNSLIAPIIPPPYHLGTASYLPFPSKSTNTFDGAYVHPSLTPSASLTPLASASACASASASVLSLEGQPSTVSLPSPPHELVKGTSASTSPTLTGDNPSNSPSHFLQQPFTPPHARRDSRPGAPHSRAVSIMSVASRHSTYSLAAMRSGQHPGSGTLRGAPHKNNMNIVLPQPLGPSSHPSSIYHMHHGESPPVHMGSNGSTSPPVQGLWNEDGEIQHPGNTSRVNMHEGECTCVVTSLRSPWFFDTI